MCPPEVISAPREVRPLPYHRAVADILERENPAAFRALTPAGSTASGELDQALLRSTYRLEQSAHPEVHAAVGRAAQALGLDVPVEIFADEGRQGANAELVFVPSRAILLFTGPTLDLLDADELCAVGGHELAHHLLWTAAGGRFLAATRLLDAAEGDARTPAAYLETARRYRLATELFADRAALAAAGTLTPAVSGLLKVATGLRQVDPEAYLRQAAEVDLTAPSAGTTHPETVVRAWALKEWADAQTSDEDLDGVDDRVSAAFAPVLDLGALDLPGQDRLLDLTRRLVRTAISVPELQTPGVLELAEQYGVDVPAQRLDASDAVPSSASRETRTYLASVLTDVATADGDSGNESWALTLDVARRAGVGTELLRLMTTELGLTDRDRRRLGERADALAGGAG